MGNDIIIKRYFKQIFDDLSEIFILTDSSGNIIDINKTGLNFFDKEELLGVHQNIKQLLNVENLDFNSQEIIELKNNRFKIEKIKFNDDFFLLKFIPHKISEEIYQQIVSKIPIAVLLFDSKGNLKYFNENFLNLWGVLTEELDNYNIFEDKQLKAIGALDKIKQVFEGKPYVFLEGYYDSLLEKGKGYRIWVETTCFSLKDNEGKVKYVVIVHKDISEVKLAQEEIVFAKKEANEANRIKRAFLENLSHEIRTPMNVILGFSEIIADYSKDMLPAEEQELVHNFRQGILRLYRTLTQILDLSQIEGSLFELQIQPIELDEIIKSVVSLYEKEAKNKNLEILLDLDPDYNIILADKICLTKALSNLVDNAIKFTNRGYVKIETFTNNAKNILFCSIKDTGIGISEEYLDHIFEPFSQEDIGFSRAYEGNGLGLALTKRYLDLINSSITVESVKGIGSTFTFSLPIFKKS